jgi:peptidoglycan/LPS O-acetylase OafA/YrhL
MIQPDPAAPAAAITVPNFAAASFLPALIAGGLLMLLGRYTTNARRAFLAIAIAFALLSLGGPATVGGASTETRVALMVMHLLAAAVITGALLRSAGEKQ